MASASWERRDHACERSRVVAELFGRLVVLIGRHGRDHCRATAGNVVRSNGMRYRTAVDLCTTQACTRLLRKRADVREPGAEFLLSVPGS